MKLNGMFWDCTNRGCCSLKTDLLLPTLDAYLSLDVSLSLMLLHKRGLGWTWLLLILWSSGLWHVVAPSEQRKELLRWSGRHYVPRNIHLDPSDYNMA